MLSHSVVEDLSVPCSASASPSVRRDHRVLSHTQGVSALGPTIAASSFLSQALFLYELLEKTMDRPEEILR